MKNILVLVSPLFLIQIAVANDTAFGGAGSAPMPIIKNEIKMVDEYIRIVGQDIDHDNMQGAWHVTCDFTFTNTANEPISLQVGFPFPVYDQESEVTSPAGRKVQHGDALVYDFNVTIDGEKVIARKQLIAPNADKGLYYQNAYIWPMQFEPLQTLKVHHDYLTGITLNSMGQTHVSYVLKTGGLWKDGTIGHTQLEVSPDVPTRLCTEIDTTAEYLKPQPAGMKIVKDGTHRKYVWDLTHFRPQVDLDLCLMTPKNFVRYTIVNAVINSSGEMSDLSKKSPQDLRLLKNTIYAQYGREFNSKDLQEYFNQQWWYKPNSNYTDALLTQEDLQALQQINRYLSQTTNNQ